MARGSKPSLKSIPVFRSEEEEAEWFNAHRDDLHEYVDMDDAEIVEPNVKADRGNMTQAVALRLPRRLVNGLRREAERREMSYQSLIKQWLSERLTQETTAAPSRRSSRRPPKAA
jgi:predicted DNA binding CopG/RHH family protein